MKVDEGRKRITKLYEIMSIISTHDRLSTATLSADGRSIVSTEGRPMVGRHSGRHSTADRRSTVSPILDRHLTDTWPIVPRYLTALDQYLADTSPMRDRHITMWSDIKGNRNLRRCYSLSGRAVWPDRCVNANLSSTGYSQLYYTIKKQTIKWQHQNAIWLNFYY